MLVALIYLLFLSCDCSCSMTILQGAVGWSAVYGCGISWSLYSLTF